MSVAGGGKGLAPAATPIQSAGTSSGGDVRADGCLESFCSSPHATLLLLSLVPVGTWTIETLPPAYTLHNYRVLITEPERLRPLVNSLWMATGSTLAALVVAVLAGILVVRRPGSGGRLIERLLALPWLVPGTVFAVALATAFSVHAPVGRAGWCWWGRYGFCRLPIWSATFPLRAERFWPASVDSMPPWRRPPHPLGQGDGGRCFG